MILKEIRLTRAEKVRCHKTPNVTTLIMNVAIISYKESVVSLKKFDCLENDVVYSGELSC